MGYDADVIQGSIDKALLDSRQLSRNRRGPSVGCRVSAQGSLPIYGESASRSYQKQEL